MSLYDEAVVALIAEGAAGKDGKLYNIKPELEVYPEELTTNGDFADPGTVTTSSWSLGWALSGGSEGDTVISGGKLTLTNAGSEARADAYMTDGSSAFFDLIDDETYYVTYNVTDNSGGAASVLKVYAGSSNAYDASSDIGTQSVLVTQSGSDNPLIFQMKSLDASITISNISVKRVKQAPLDFTFTRGSNLTATRVGPDGLIEKGREQKLYNTVWAGVDEDTAPTGYTASIDNNGTFDATGTDGQIRFTCATATDRGYIQFSQSFTDNGVFAVSVNVDTVHTACRVGSVVGIGGGTKTLIGYFEDGVKINLTDNVQEGKRYTYVFNKTAGTSYARYGMGVDAGRAGDLTLSKPQFEIGMAATDYIENTSTSTTKDAGILEDSPRFDYTGVTCPHLLMEPTRKNLVPYSEYFTFEGRTTITYNHDTSPEGVDNSTKITNTTESGGHRTYTDTFDVTSGDTYTASVFAKKGSLKKLSFEVMASNEASIGFDEPIFNLDDGTIGGDSSNASMVDYGNGWYRCIVTSSPTSTPSDARVYFYLREDDDTKSYAGTTSQNMELYGAQVEEGHYATSYIPNHGTSAGVTRNDDVTDAVDFGDYMDGEDITWFVDLAKNDQIIRDGATTGIRLSTTDLNASSVKFYRSYENLANGGIKTVVYFADDENDNDPASHQITEAGPVKVIVRRVKSTGEFTVFYDGAQKYQAFAPANYGKLKSLKIDGENQPLFINNMFLFDRALTDDECIDLTT